MSIKEQLPRVNLLFSFLSAQVNEDDDMESVQFLRIPLFNDSI